MSTTGVIKRIRLEVAITTTYSKFILIVVAIMFFYMARVITRRRYMAPGPPRFPLLGNILQLPSDLQFIKFTEWAKEYGSLYSIDLLGQHVLILNSHKTAIDLLERRSSIYSDRPRLVMVNEILTQGLDFVRYGALWRKLRRATHSNFNSNAVTKFEPFQTKASAQGVLRMIANPENWEQNLDIFAISTIYTSIYGRSISPESAIIERTKAHIGRLVKDATPGLYLCELFPLLKIVPAWMASWKREALEWHYNENQFFEEQLVAANEEAHTDLGRRCFAAEMLEKEGEYDLTRKEMAWLAGGMLGAGGDTTSVALSNFVLAMILHPDVMRKAQAEVDEVVGRDRPPTFTDIGELPYVCAVIREPLRWRPVAPVAVLRRLIKDDWYQGYFIPKGTTVIANIWNLNRDPELYPDFDIFRPERFLDMRNTEAMSAMTHGFGHVSFGFGRRGCTGQHFANQSMFIFVSMMLWALDFNPAVDKKGEPVIPSANEWIDEGIVARPKHFECRITPRFPDAHAILEAFALDV